MKILRVGQKVFMQQVFSGGTNMEVFDLHVVVWIMYNLGPLPARWNINQNGQKQNANQTQQNTYIKKHTTANTNIHNYK